MIVIGVILAQLLRSIIDDIMMPIAYSFTNNPIHPSSNEVYWENINTKIENPFNNNTIVLKFGKIISNLIYVIIALITIFIIYKKILIKIDKKIFINAEIETN